VSILEAARRVLSEETEALSQVKDKLDENFVAAVEQILSTQGRVVVTGMGKSGHIGRKIAATLASTGSPAFFLHPAEALHGDLGMVGQGDVVLALSYSGESDELRAILPALKRRASVLIAMTGGKESRLAQAADIVLDVSVTKEACPLNLAPTTSTTVMLALGDALAVATMEARGFGSEDYAKLHPAGSLGRRLLLRVSDLMRVEAELAIVLETATVRDALFAITRAGAGATCVVDSSGKLTGLLTDGDVRRFDLEREGETISRSVSEAMTKTPRTLSPDLLAAEALEYFQRESGKMLGEIPVVNSVGEPVGILMLKDIVRAGITLPQGEN
jgi:arabinose-5-phosphate isomerase